MPLPTEELQRHYFSGFTVCPAFRPFRGALQLNKFCNYFGLPPEIILFDWATMRFYKDHCKECICLPTVGRVFNHQQC